MARFGIEARVTKRRGLYAVYLKGAEPIVTFLALVGAHRALLRTEDVRILKSMRNDVNRLVNAETANLQKSADAAIAQVEDIRYLADVHGLDWLPPALQELAQLRLDHPDVSIRELGEYADAAAVEVGGLPPHPAARGDGGGPAHARGVRGRSA